MTTTDVQTLSDEEKRRKLAELLGYKLENWGIIRPDGRECARGYKSTIDMLPDWPNDLNAIAAIEKTLRGKRVQQYQHHLERIVYRDTTDEDWFDDEGPSPRTRVWHASAAQRTEALILTLSK